MLSVRNLTKIYKIKGGNDTKALDNVTVDFPEKGMVFLLGKSGSGKSTLLNLIGGLDFPTSGEIILKGRSSKDFSQSDFDSYRNTYIGFIFQEYNILNEFNVEQNIALAIELQGKKVTKEAVDELLEQVDLTGYGKRKPNTLSGGQKQRIAIARALIKQPNIIMADEPTGALDSKTGEQVFETLKKLSSDKLVIVVSHDRDFAERFGDRIIELKDGQILSDETKHMVASTPISDNVTIINDHAIKIEDAKKLTKKDFDKLYESITKTEGKVFISSGENADKSMKVARISEDGRSDEFKTTDNVDLKEYDASKTTFIRSKMPMNKSVKMGLSSLKTKPVRLVFTIFLSIISFTMFGVASALMLYNPSHTYSEALRKTDYKAEGLQKFASGRYVYRQIDRAGNVVYENSYPSTQDAMFGANEVKELNKNNLGLVYIPVGPLEGNFSFANLDYKKNATYYNRYYRFRYASDTSKEEFDKLGYTLEGNYPVNDDEILLPKIFGEMLIDSGAVTRSNYHDIIGSSFKFNTMKGNTNYKVVGFFDAEGIPTTYAQLANEESKLTPTEQNELGQDLEEYLRCSFNTTVFVTPNAFNNFKYANNYTYVDTYNRSGARIDMYDVRKEEVREEDWISVYTDEIYRQNSSSFVLFDLDGHEITLNNFALKDDEVYASKYMFENNAYALKNNFLSYFIGIDTNQQSMRFMPTYRQYYVNNLEVIDELRMNYYEQIDAIEQLYNYYKDEFAKAYKIVTFGNDYRWTDDFNTLSTANQELFDKVLNINGENKAITAQEIADVYQILTANYDKQGACKNLIIRRYFENAYFGNEANRIYIEGNATLFDIWNKSYDSWNESEVQAVKDFLNEKCQNGLNSNKSWDNILKGYTFNEYQPVPEQVFQADKNLKYYYSSYNGANGELKVIGYYSLGNDEYRGEALLTKTFVDSITQEWKDQNPNEYTYESYFESDYQEPADVRYSRLLVKTNYTQEQIDYMMKCNEEHCKYTFTSARYYSVSYIVDLISILKNVFFWVGVGFGVFSALMFLNFITISISSKKKDIGILRAIGARKSDVFKIFFSESLFIAAVCALISIILTFVAEFFLDRYFVSEIGISILQFSVITVGLVVGVALFIAFIATIFPVIHSSRKPPVESIRAL